MTHPPDEAHDQHAPPREALRRFLGEWVTYLADGGGAMIMALWQARREDPEMSAMLSGIYEQGRKPYVEALRRISRRPGPEEAYVIIVDALLGAVLFRCVHRLCPIAAHELDLLVDQAVRTALDLEVAEAGGPEDAGQRPGPPITAL